jgi:hypothetical protein
MWSGSLSCGRPKHACFDKIIVRRRIIVQNGNSKSVVRSSVSQLPAPDRRPWNPETRFNFETNSERVLSVCLSVLVLFRYPTGRNLLVGLSARPLHTS